MKTNKTQYVHAVVLTDARLYTFSDKDDLLTFVSSIPPSMVFAVGTDQPVCPHEHVDEAINEVGRLH